MSKGGPKMVTASSGIPKKYEPFVDNVLSAAGTLANRPYVEYEGPTIAGFTPDQVTGFDMVRRMPGVMQPMINAALNTQLAGVSSVTDPSKMMDKYTNRFEDDVIDSVTADLQRERDTMNTQARLNSPFGGSRAALIEAENNRNYLDRLGRLTGEMRMRNFSDAARLGQSAADQLMRGGSSMMQGAGQAQTLGMNQAGALSGIGQQIQALNQLGMRDSEARFLDRLNYPISNLSMLQSAIGATPMGTVSRVPVQRSNNFGGILSGIGSILSGGASAGIF